MRNLLKKIHEMRNPLKKIPWMRMTVRSFARIRHRIVKILSMMIVTVSSRTGRKSPGNCRRGSRSGCCRSLWIPGTTGNFGFGLGCGSSHHGKWRPHWTHPIDCGRFYSWSGCSGSAARNTTWPSAGPGSAIGIFWRIFDFDLKPILRQRIVANFGIDNVNCSRVRPFFAWPWMFWIRNGIWRIWRWIYRCGRRCSWIPGWRSI